jgi:hypothetical protein
MNLAIFRVEGTDEALNALRGSIILAIDSSWKTGEPKRRGGHYSSAGLNATIADAENPHEMVIAIREFITQCKARNIAFSDANLSAEISIGITVGDEVRFVASVDLSASDLLSLGELGIALGVAAYPASDEDDANEKAA